LFSYIEHQKADPRLDSNDTKAERPERNKIRCFTIYTMYDMLAAGIYKHPCSQESFPDEALERANKIFKLYSSKFGIFAEDLGDLTEFKVRSHAINLFNKFRPHAHIDPDHFMKLKSRYLVNKLISQFNTLIAQNLVIVNPKLKVSDIKIFKWSMKSDSENMLEAQNHLLNDMETLLTLSEIPPPNNPLLIWLIVGAMGKVIKEIAEKYNINDIFIE
jgi:hypothetical protein